METITQKSNLFKRLKTYIWSKNFLVQIIILLVIAVISTFIGLWTLNVITHHGEAISVPNLEGLSLSEAQKIAKEKEITLIVIDSVYLAPGARGSVVEQNPPFNFKVKEGRKIFITIKAFLPEMTLMPDLHDISLQQAKAELENYGLKIGKLDYASGYENVVIEQTYKGSIIAPNSTILKRERINLLLGRGSYPYTNMVDLNGLTLDDAYNKLSSIYLNVGKIVYDNTIKNSADSANAQIYKQEPSILYPQKLNFGSRVNLWFTKDKIKIISNKITIKEPLEEVQTETEEPEENIVPD